MEANNRFEEKQWTELKTPLTFKAVEHHKVLCAMKSCLMNSNTNYIFALRWSPFWYPIKYEKIKKQLHSYLQEDNSYPSLSSPFTGKADAPWTWVGYETRIVPNHLQRCSDGLYRLPYQQLARGRQTSQKCHSRLKEVTFLLGYFPV